MPLRGRRRRCARAVERLEDAVDLVEVRLGAVLRARRVVDLGRGEEACDVGKACGSSPASRAESGRAEDGCMEGERGRTHERGPSRRSGCAARKSRGRRPSRRRRGRRRRPCVRRSTHPIVSVLALDERGRGGTKRQASADAPPQARAVARRVERSELLGSVEPGVARGQDVVVSSRSRAAVQGSASGLARLSEREEERAGKLSSRRTSCRPPPRSPPPPRPSPTRASRRTRPGSRP